MKNEIDSICKIMDVLLAYQPIIDVPYEKINDIAIALVKEGYGDISEYKAEIERLKAENETLKTNLRKLEEKCAEFDKLCYDYNKLLYIMRCNMTSVTRYVRNENEAYNARYKELAEKAVENILKTINHKGKE